MFKEPCIWMDGSLKIQRTMQHGFEFRTLNEEEDGTKENNNDRRPPEVQTSIYIDCWVNYWSSKHFACGDVKLCASIILACHCHVLIKPNEMKMVRIKKKTYFTKINK